MKGNQGMGIPVREEATGMGEIEIMPKPNGSDEKYLNLRGISKKSHKKDHPKKR